MSDYHAPVKEMMFVITELAGLDQIAKLPGLEDATSDLVDVVLGVNLCMFPCLKHICVIVTFLVSFLFFNSHIRFH